MDIAAFYAVVAGVNFTLLGLWWVAVQDKVDLRDRAERRMAYVVALQFMVPGTASLISQGGPGGTSIWPATFTLAGVAGAVGVLQVVPVLKKASSRGAAIFMLAV